MEPQPNYLTKSDIFHARAQLKAAALGALIGVIGGGAVTVWATLRTRDAKADLRAGDQKVAATEAQLRQTLEQLEAERRLSEDLRRQLVKFTSTPSPGAALVTETSPQSPAASAPTTSPVTFHTRYYDFVVSAVTKSGPGVRVDFYLEATLDQKVRVSYGGCGIGPPDQIYLLDENGERWEVNYANQGSERFTRRFEPLDLFPGTRVRGNFLFVEPHDSRGTKFTLSLRECDPDAGAQHSFRGLTAS